MNAPNGGSLHEAIERADLPALIERHCQDANLRRLNSRRGGVICDPRPGREERNPSFSVYFKGGRWRWRNFATSEYGDALDLLESLGIPKREAIKELLKDAGLGGARLHPSRWFRPVQVGRRVEDLTSIPNLPPDLLDIYSACKTANVPMWAHDVVYLHPLSAPALYALADWLADCLRLLLPEHPTPGAAYQARVQARLRGSRP